MLVGSLSSGVGLLSLCLTHETLPGFSTVTSFLDTGHHYANLRPECSTFFIKYSSFRLAGGAPPSARLAMRSSSFNLLVALTLALLSDAEPLPGPLSIHEKRTQPPTGWSLTRRHDATSTIPLRFALKQRNIEDIGNYLYDVSHPKSPNYGKHWTAGDIARKFAASDETVDTIRSWLIESGISEKRIALGRTKGWIQVDATVQEAEQLMNTEYNVYTHISGKEHVGELKCWLRPDYLILG